MKLKYVGVKEDGETAFSRETGITWFPGSVEDVPTAMAVKMLQHPDVFAEADEQSPAKPVIANAAGLTLAPGGSVGSTGPLEGLDDAGVRAYAKANGVAIKGIGLLKGDNLRAKVTAALAEKT